jgi:hypothetical protein
MKIRSFYLAQLHNGEHATYHFESLEHLKLANPDSLGVSEEVKTYEDALDNQKQTIDVFAATESSSESYQLDGKRDKSYRAFKAYLKVYVNDEDPVLSSAAERLLFIVRESAIELGDPLSLSLAKETTAINSLLRNLEPLQADIELIGAGKRLNELKNANSAFEKLQIERNIEKAGKHSGNVKDARIVTDLAYKTIVERINAQALLYGSAAFETFIKEQNAIIDKYATLVARRKGIAKKAGKAGKSEDQ